MNKRILKLFNEAGFHQPEMERLGIEDKFEKFAELIVKECIGCCEQVISDPVPESVDTWLNGGEQCVQEIKQHFGVEE